MTAESDEPTRKCEHIYEPFETPWKDFEMLLDSYEEGHPFTPTFCPDCGVKL